MKKEFIVALTILGSLLHAPFPITATELQLIEPVYRALNTDTVKEYLYTHRDIAARLGGTPSKWKAREVGDGNLNLVFIVEGQRSSVVIKQALPYVRLVGESWPLPLTRSHFEHMALVAHSKVASEYVPVVFHHNQAMALTVMEYLSPHIVLRKGLIRGIKYPHMAEHLGLFLANTLFHTSDLFLPPSEKRANMIRFAANSAMCKITEDLVFDDPYYESPLNHWTTPQLDEWAEDTLEDTELKCAVQEMKWRFLNHTEALIHGDLHTGSVMVTETDTRVIDPEFAVYGPMGFDIGAIMGNLLIAYYAQPGQGKTLKARDAYAAWILEQIPIVWNTFSHVFTKLCKERGPEGAAYNMALAEETPDYLDAAIQQRLSAIWNDTLGFAGAKMIRRVLGLAHVEDLEGIKDPDLRATCEARVLGFGRRLLVDRAAFPTPEALIELATTQ